MHISCKMVSYNETSNQLHRNTLKRMILYLIKTPYRINAQIMQCLFSVSQVKECQSPGFVISMSKNPSFNCYRLWRLVVSYKGKISLYFDLPSLYSCCTQSLLLRALIRIHACGLSRLNVDSPFSFLGIQEKAALINDDKLRA